MHLLKSALGVKIFLAVWLVILLVPVWRLRALRGWQSAQFYPAQVSPPRVSLGLAPQTLDEAVRRFPGDSSIQLANMSRPYLGRRDSTWPGEEQMQPATDAYFSRYAVLVRRFPDDLALRASWLRDTTKGALNIESKELMASYHLPTTTLAPTWMSPTQLRRSVEVARQSQRLEPDNAFWAWMEALLLFAQSDNQAALTALQRAGGCSRFDDRVDATTRARIALMRRMQVTDFDDELWETLSSLFPHYARMRSAARQTMWLANLALKRGDTARALEIAAILQRASTPVAHSRGFYIGRLVGEAMCYIAWRQTIFYAGLTPASFEPATDPTGSQLRLQQVNQFATFARAHGRDDLAREALTAQTGFNGQQMEAALKSPRFDGLWQAAQPLTRFRWISSWLVRLALVSALLWLLTFGFSRRGAPLATEQRRRMAITLAFCLGVTGACLIASALSDMVRQLNLFGDVAPPPDPVDAEEQFSWLLAGFWCALVLLMTIFATLKQKAGARVESKPLPIASPHPGWLRVAGVALHLLTLTSLTIVCQALSEPLDNSTAGQLWPWPVIVLALLLVATSAWHLRRAQPHQKVSTLLMCCAVLLFISTFLFQQGWAVEGDSFLLWLACGAASCLLLAGAFLTGRKRPWKNERLSLFWHGLVMRARITAAALAVGSTLAYVVVAGVTMPFRAHAQTVLNVQLREGEAAFILAQMQHQPAPK